MSSGRNAFGLRIALWYATLFVAGAVAIVLLTYYLLSVSPTRVPARAASRQWCGPSRQ